VLPGGVLSQLSLLDPACGSGAFLVAALKTLVNLYSALLGQIRVKFQHDDKLQEWLREVSKHRSEAYYIRRRIITDNLYGVDLMPEAVEIAKLRLFLALVATARTVDELEPLPNIDFNLLAGNSLVGRRQGF
jgi:23S rRNA G2445 N2-methylase RlmL